MNNLSMQKPIIFKILFALEIALLPFMLAMRFLVGDFAMSIVLAIILVVKIAIIFFKNPADLKQLILDAVGNFVVLAFVLITYSALNYVSVVTSVLAIIFFLIEEVMRVYFFYKPNNQLTEALTFSVALFMFVVLGTFIFIPLSDLMAQVALYAIIIATIIYDAYQAYIFARYYVIKKKRPNKTSKKK